MEDGIDDGLTYESTQAPLHFGVHDTFGDRVAVGHLVTLSPGRESNVGGTHDRGNVRIFRILGSMTHCLYRRQPEVDTVCRLMIWELMFI